MTEPLLRVENLRKEFESKGRVVHALNGVDLSIEAGETLGLVGESGCGKSTLGKCIVGLLSPTSGRVTFDGEDLAACSMKRMYELRKSVQILFQDPALALTPTWTVQRLITEPLKLHGFPDRETRVQETLEDVGLHPELLVRRPHQLSGGQRQRVALARAIITKPKLVVLDEPTASVDMSLRLSLLSLLRRLQREHGLSYLFISHDLATVRHLCDRLEVMYLGRVVERGPTPAVFSEPTHVYTRTLLSAIPAIDRSGRVDRLPAQGEPSSPTLIPTGCPFHPRCREAMDECLGDQPFHELGNGHDAACRLAKPRVAGASAS